MKPIRVDPFTGALNFLSILASGNSGPLGQITTELEGITVDTSLPQDTGKWETGINRLKVEGKWVIVEQYTDKKEAEQGHKNWVNLMTEYPDYPLKDIDLWSLDTEEN